VADPVIALIDMSKYVQEVLAIRIVLENGLLFVSPRGHMIDRTGVFNAKRASHEINMAEF